MAMNCPRCGAGLTAVQVEGGGPEIDSCPACKGAWYDEGETRIEVLVKGLKAARISCPRCKVPLWVGHCGEGGPELDYCTRCGGVWADAGELEAIGAAHPGGRGNGGPDPTAPIRALGRHDYPYQLEGRPEFAMATVEIPADKTLKVEASAMAAMDPHVEMKTKFRGGLARLLTGESLFLNEFTPRGAPGRVAVAPGPPGDIAHVYVDGEAVFLQNSSYLASGPDVLVETKWQGLTKGFFSGESLFLIRCSGKGDLWFNTYGALFSIDVDGDYVVDTGHIVAFTQGLEYQVRRVGGYKSLFFSGEGFVCRFTGKGKVWVQTRQVPALAAWVFPFRPQKKR